ncbi:MAG: hypothetical protein HY040_00590 [Planctomycetes bacterium]|nr:hypothetical protein [Planctomycetota bacterium]
MNTLIITLSAVLGQAGEEIQSPLWQRDYTQAKQRAAQEKKPMAVFLAPGENSMNRLIPGGLSDQAKRILSDKYICVMIDTNTPKGQQLAMAFDIRQGQGLIISDRGGAYQAYWQPGIINNQILTRNLQRFADMTDIQVTMIAGRPSFYQGEDGPMQPIPQQGRMINRRGEAIYADSTLQPTERRRILFRNRAYNGEGRMRLFGFNR